MTRHHKSLIAGVLEQARTTGHLGVARLLSPEETAEALKELKRSTDITGWFLCGEFHPAMWALAQAHPDELDLSDGRYHDLRYLDQMILAPRFE